MASTRIIFSDDVSVVVSTSLDSVQQGIYEAIDNGGWMVIHPEEGRGLSINPSRILYMEEVSPAEAMDETDWAEYDRALMKRREERARRQEELAEIEEKMARIQEELARHQEQLAQRAERAAAGAR